MRSRLTLLAILALTSAVSNALSVSHSSREKPSMNQTQPGKYANVNGLKMYYEVHGKGEPIVLLHGAFATIEGWGPILTDLAKTRKVIAVEMQGHGHTADIDRPMTYTGLADDVAALLKSLDIKSADVFGYSLGGSVAFRLAAKHPELVRKLAVLGANTRTAKETFEPESYQQLKSIVPEEFNFPVLKDPYTRVAPDPSKWTVLVRKVLKLDDGETGLSPQETKGIKAPTLIMMGDRDGVKPEHAVEVFRLIPKAQLAIFPGGDHFLPFTNPDKVLAALTAFLDAPK